MRNRNYLFQYIRIEYKRIIKAFVSMLLFMFLVIGLIGLISFGAFKIMYHAADYDKIVVGMVLPEGDSARTLKALAGLISTQESVSDICTFSYVTKEEALEKVADGEMGAAIILNDSFLYFFRDLVDFYELI